MPQIYDSPGQARRRPSPEEAVAAIQMAVQQAAANVHPAPSLMDQAQQAVSAFDNQPQPYQDRSNWIGMWTDPVMDFSQSFGENILPNLQRMFAGGGDVNLSMEQALTPTYSPEQVSQAAAALPGAQIQQLEDFGSDPLGYVKENPVDAILLALAGVGTAAKYGPMAEDALSAVKWGDETGAVDPRAFMPNDPAFNTRPPGADMDPQLSKALSELSPEELRGVADQLGLDEEMTQHLMSQSRTERPMLRSEPPVEIAPMTVQGRTTKGYTGPNRNFIEDLAGGYADSDPPLSNAADDALSSPAYGMVNAQNTEAPGLIDRLLDSIAREADESGPSQKPTLTPEQAAQIEAHDASMREAGEMMREGSTGERSNTVFQMGRVKPTEFDLSKGEAPVLDVGSGPVSVQKVMEGDTSGVMEAPPAADHIDYGIAENSVDDALVPKYEPPGFPDRVGAEVENSRIDQLIDQSAGTYGARDFSGLMERKAREGKVIGLPKQTEDLTNAYVEASTRYNRSKGWLSRTIEAHGPGSKQAIAARSAMLDAKQAMSKAEEILTKKREGTAWAMQGKRPIEPVPNPEYGTPLDATGKKVAIVGSREGVNPAAVKQYIDTLPTDGSVTIVSGGAKGVDQVAAAYAKERGIPVEEYPANWNRQPDGTYDKAAGFKRNQTIVNNADEVVAFHANESRGTADTISKARKAGKKVDVRTGNPPPLTTAALKERGIGDLVDQIGRGERDTAPITSFDGENRFLSNFADAPVEYEGVKYANSEAAFQAAKTADEVEKARFSKLTGRQAKSYGKSVKLRPDWESVKDDIMYDVVKAKFEQNPRLREKLLATGDSPLVEGNTWNDREWGKVNGVGKNKLGKILERVRDELRGEAPGISAEQRQAALNNLRNK